jgi:hypothetical protein
MTASISSRVEQEQEEKISAENQSGKGNNGREQTHLIRDGMLQKTSTTRADSVRTEDKHARLGRQNFLLSLYLELSKATEKSRTTARMLRLAQSHPNQAGAEAHDVELRGASHALRAQAEKLKAAVLSWADFAQGSRQTVDSYSAHEVSRKFDKLASVLCDLEARMGQTSY